MVGKATWNEPFSIDPLEVHRDARGALYEAIRFGSQNIPSGGQIYVYTVAPGARRGDHYHEKKGEWFFCASGQVRLLMKAPGGETVNEVLDADSPRLVYAAPGTSHAVVNETDEVALIVAYASKEFDPSDPDTVVRSAT